MQIAHRLISYRIGRTSTMSISAISGAMSIDRSDHRGTFESLGEIYGTSGVDGELRAFVGPDTSTLQKFVAFQKSWQRFSCKWDRKGVQRTGSCR